MSVKNGNFVAGCISQSINKDTQTQPCGFDLTLKEIYEITSAGTIGFLNKNLPEYKKIFDNNEAVQNFLNKGAYKIIFNEIVKIPKNCIGLVFPRSTLLRMGCEIHTAVWDAGYVGRGEALLNVFNEHGIYIEKNTRICQMILLEADNPLRVYNGDYQYSNM